MGIGRLAIALILSVVPCVAFGLTGFEYDILYRNALQRMDWLLGALAACGILGGLIYHQWLLYKDRTDED